MDDIICKLICGFDFRLSNSDILVSFSFIYSVLTFCLVNLYVFSMSKAHYKITCYIISTVTWDKKIR